MPISYRIDSDLGVVFEEWVGTIAPDEVRAHWTRMLSDPQALRCRRSLADLRRLNVTLPWSQLSSISRIIFPMVGPGRWRIAEVVANEAQYGRVMQFKATTESIATHAIFYGVDEALAWLLQEDAG